MRIQPKRPENLRNRGEIRDEALWDNNPFSCAADDVLHVLNSYPELVVAEGANGGRWNRCTASEQGQDYEQRRIESENSYH